MTPPLWQKEKGTQEPLGEVKEESEKVVNSFFFCLSGKLPISPTVLNDSFVG